MLHNQDLYMICAQVDGLRLSYPQNQCVHQPVYTRPFELCASAVLHQLGVWTYGNGPIEKLPGSNVTASFFLKMRVNHKHTHTCEYDKTVAALRVA